jgi:adenylate cyclase
MNTLGRFDDVIPLVEKAMRLHPYYPAYYLQFLGGAYRMLGRYEDALTVYKQLLGRSRKGEFPIFPAHLFLADVYAELGREEEARTHAAEVLRLKPGFSLKDASRVTTYRYKDPAHLERRLNALRKAGIPDKAPLPLPDKPSIAVLPFVNMSGDPEQEYFSDGITEEIITALSKTPKLFVIARNSTFTYKNKPTRVQKIGRELGVKYVLEGSVRKAGDKVRITAQLVDAKTGNHLWAERYDRELKDIFAIQDDITKNIITEVQVQLTAGVQARFKAGGTKNLDAYLNYLQAWDHLRHFNKEDSIRARELAEKTIALDPDFEKGYSVLAFVEIVDVWVGLSKSPKESLMRAMKLAKKSIAIEDSPLPHRVLATTYVLFRKHDAAIAEARKAVQMAPNYADAYMTLGHVYMLSDMGEEAVPVLQKAIRLNPYPPSPYFHNLAWSYYLLGKYDEAIAEAKKAIGVSPKDIIAHRALICSYLSLGREEEARAQAAEVLRIDPNFSVDRAEKRSPIKNKDKVKKIFDSYRKAGLK